MRNFDSFKTFFYNESTGDDVKAIFKKVDKGSETYMQELFTAVSILADYLDSKGNHTKADLMRFHLEDPDHMENIELLFHIADTAKEGFASPYASWAEFQETPDERGPNFSAHLIIDDVLDFFEVSPENRERIEIAMDRAAWDGDAYVYVRVPVREEYAKQAYDAQMSVRQLIHENPQYRGRLLDYDKMEVDTVQPRNYRPTGFVTGVPNIKNLVMPHGLNRHMINKLRPKIEKEFEKPSQFFPNAMPPISNDYEDYTALLWDVRRMNGGN